MVEFNPPKHDKDFPHHELYAQEGHQKFYRIKGGHKPEEKSTKEHELPYWEGKDHS